MEVMKLYRVFASLPKNLLEAVATGVKDKVTPAGDSCGVKRKWGDVEEQTRQPSTHRTPTNKVPPRSQPRQSHDSHSVKKKWEEIENQQLYQLWTPNFKLPSRSQHQLSHDSHITKKKRGEKEHRQLCPSREQLSSPNFKQQPRLQPQMSHESYMMKRKLWEHLYASGEQKRQHFSPLNKPLAGLQSSQDPEPQSMRSGPVAGGVVQVLADCFLRLFTGDEAGVLQI